MIPTWDQACLSWIAANPGISNKYESRKFLKWWKQHLSGKRLSKIDALLIHQTITNHRPGVDPEKRVKANSTANDYVHFVSRIIRHGSNLNPRFVQYPAIRFGEKWYRPDQWGALVRHFSDDERDIFTYLVSTGQREANAMFLEWPWLDGAAVFTPAANTKTDVPYGTPLNKSAQSVIEIRRRAPVKHLKYVFTNQGKVWYRVALCRALRRACKKAGVAYISPHGLRHTFNTWLARAGVPKEIRQRLVSHTHGDVHDGYTHFDVESLRPYSEVIDRILVSSGAESSQATD